ncbi:hypothetical protein AVEN_131792-1, partial [Araneus ventricosus]
HCASFSYVALARGRRTPHQAELLPECVRVLCAFLRAHEVRNAVATANGSQPLAFQSQLFRTPTQSERGRICFALLGISSRFWNWRQILQPPSMEEMN